MERLIVRFRQVGYIGTAVTLVTALGALGLTWFANRHPELDVASHFTGHFIGLTIAAALGLVLRWRPLLITTLGLFLTLATHTLIAEFRSAPGPLPAMIDGRPILRVAAVNAWHHNTDTAALVDFLMRDQSDVVLLAEFGPNKLELLHTLEKLYPYRATCAEEWGCAMAVLSRRPFSASGTTLGRGFGPVPRAWIRYGEGVNSLTIIAAHVIKPIDSPLLQRAQLDELVADVKAAPGAVIVAGDFNMTPWSHAFRQFRQRSGLGWPSGLLPSFPAGVRGLPQLAIDHVFASPSLIRVASGVGDETGSDHRPIVAAMTLPAGIPWTPLPRFSEPRHAPLALAQ